MNTQTYYFRTDHPGVCLQKEEGEGPTYWEFSNRSLLMAAKMISDRDITVCLLKKFWGTLGYDILRIDLQGLYSLLSFLDIGLTYSKFPVTISTVSEEEYERVREVVQSFKDTALQLIKEK